MMGRDVELVIKLQGLDTRIAELQREINSLPHHIAEIEKAVVAHRRKLEADQAALAANQKERRRLEGEVQVLEQKAARLKEQMLEARTNEQYHAFQHEIAYVENEIRKAEDRILDLMAESEPLEENVQKAEEALRQETEEVEREKAAARERSAEDRRLLEQCLAERKEAVAAIDAKIYATYERARKKYGGVALAEGTDGRCSACHIALRPQFYQDLKRGEQLMVCETCGRLLYYHAAMDVEAGG